MLVRLMTAEDEDEPGDYEFEVLPRAGEIIELAYARDRGPNRPEADTYRVEEVVYRFSNHAKPPIIALCVRKV